ILAVVAERKNQGPAFNALITEWADAGARVVKSAAELQRLCSREATQSSLDRSGGLKSALRSMLVSCLFIGLAGGLIGWWLSANIGAVLLHSLGQLSEAAGQLNGISNQVASSSQALAQGASQQAAALEESSATAEEIRAMAQRNSRLSHSAVDLVNSSDRDFSAANQTLDQVVDAMNDLTSQGANISKIIRVIDEIAFQTTILALNASA